MNEKCKYCLTAMTCPKMCEENSIYCAMHRRFPKNLDGTFVQLQEENRKYKEVIEKLNDLLSDEFLEVIDRDTLLDILKNIRKKDMI